MKLSQSFLGVKTQYLLNIFEKFVFVYNQGVIVYVILLQCHFLDICFYFVYFIKAHMYDLVPL